MKTRTSIPFEDLTGTAGNVTARSTRFGTVLSGRCQQPKKVTPQQKDMRALFARVGRSFKRLSPEQVTAWAAFATPQAECLAVQEYRKKEGPVRIAHRSFCLQGDVNRSRAQSPRGRL